MLCLTMARLVVVLALYCPLLAVTNASAPKPHIVMIIADDLGWNDLGFRKQNEKEVRTPVLDNLAKTGRVLENYYVQPTCSPTRASFMTGRYPVHTGVANAIPPDAAYGLPLNETTLAQLLRAQGYRTHAIGKWHLGFVSYAHTPTFRGFESFYGFYGGGEDYFVHRQHQAFDFRRDSREFCGKDCSHVATEDIGKYSTHLFADEAVKVISNHDLSQPLFLWLAFQAVHWPDMVPKEYSEPYAGVFDGDKEFGERRQLFAGMLACLDEGVGRVLDALRSQGMLEDTFLIFTTDNGGPSDRDRKDETPTGSSNTPLRGGKGTIYEGGTRGTAIVSGAGLADMGTPVTGLMHAVDWVPTLLGMIGANILPASTLPLDGENVWAGMSGHDCSKSPRTLQYYGVAQSYMHGPAVRLGNLKLVLAYPAGGYHEVRSPRGGALHPPSPTFLAKTIEGQIELEQRRQAWMARNYETAKTSLYDLEADVDEAVDIAQHRPEDVQNLLALLSVVEAHPACMDCSDPRCPAAAESQSSVQVDGKELRVWEPYCDEHYPPPQAPPAHFAAGTSIAKVAADSTARAIEAANDFWRGANVAS